MGNEWGGRLRLVPFFNGKNKCVLKEMPEGLPMPRNWSKIYQANDGILYASGKESERCYTDLLHSLNFNSKIIYKWISLDNLIKIKGSLKLRGENYFEDDELDFEDDENFEGGFQGAD